MSNALHAPDRVHTGRERVAVARALTKDGRRSVVKGRGMEEEVSEVTEARVLLERTAREGFRSMEVSAFRTVRLDALMSWGVTKPVKLDTM